MNFNLVQFIFNFLLAFEFLLTIEKAHLEVVKQIGMLPVEERGGFAEKFTPVLAQLEQKAITRKQAARALVISGPTLKRILDGQPTPTRQKPVVDGERVALVV